MQVRVHGSARRQGGGLPRWCLLLALFAALVFAGVGFRMVGGNTTTPPSLPTSGVSSASTGVVSSTSTASTPGMVSFEQWWGSQADTVVERVSAGLNRCVSAAYFTGSGSVAGVEVGQPRTLQGAVGFTASYAMFRFSPTWLVDSIREPVEAVMRVTASPQTVVDVERFGVLRPDATDIGELLPYDGEFVSRVWPIYGAYRVVVVVHDSAGVISGVGVEWMLPREVGLIEDGRAYAEASFVYPVFWVAWLDGAWRMVGDMLDEAPRSPAWVDGVVLSFADRDKMLPDTGWCVTADAIEERDISVIAGRS